MYKTMRRFYGQEKNKQINTQKTGFGKLFFAKKKQNRNTQKYTIFKNLFGCITSTH